ncbi:hypothetical protein [Caldifermentibacillus hisashii]|uniref:hypothetical protein n=1 Tax=Caldifermentibacillus hisashii TaxID=996558 RepID=UPI0030E98F8B
METRDFKRLKVLDKLQWFFDRMGVNYSVMRKILQVKMIMDERRVPTIFNQNKKKDGTVKKESNGFIKSLWVYLLMSLFLLPFIFLGGNYLFLMSLIFGIIMFMVMTTMVSDFSTVLLDIRDKNILYTRPIDRKTINMAKNVHVMFYLLLLTAALVGIPVLAGLFRHGVIFFLITVTELILLNMFIVVITALIYMAILKFFDGEKLKDIINYVQIILSLSIMVGYQVVVRSFELVNLDIVFIPKWWHLFIPPIWFAAPYELFLNHVFSPTMVVLSIFAVLIPIASFLLYLRLIPSFEKSLEKLSALQAQKEKKRGKIGESLLKLICRDQTERASFCFAGIMMKTERDFKLRVYPSLGFSIVIPFILFFNQIASQPFAETAASNLYLSIYFAMIVIPSVVLMLSFSGKYKGAWIFQVIPVQNMETIISGTLKAFLVRLYVPIYVLLSVIFAAIFGVRIIPDLVIVFLTSCLYTLICFLFRKITMPFSEPFEAAKESDSWYIFGLMLIILPFFGLHYLSLYLPFGKYLYMIVLAVALVFGWRWAIGLKLKNVRV